MKRRGSCFLTCESCLASDWGSSKTQHIKFDDGTEATIRYRVCKNCGRRIKTYQIGDDEQLMTDELAKRQKKYESTSDLKKYVQELQQPKKKIKLHIKTPGLTVTVEHGGQMHKEECLSYEESLELIRKFFEEEVL